MDFFLDAFLASLTPSSEFGTPRMFFAHYPLLNMRKDLCVCDALKIRNKTVKVKLSSASLRYDIVKQNVFMVDHDRNRDCRGTLTIHRMWVAQHDRRKRDS